MQMEILEPCSNCTALFSAGRDLILETVFNAAKQRYILKK